jgi:hypothetical protein
MANSNAYLNVTYSFGAIGAPNGGAVSVFPTPGHPEYGQAFPLRYPWTNCPTPPTPMQELADEGALWWLITNNVNRNFYYNGHGNPDAVHSITSENIRALNNGRHYYRFVFLDGCSTANGSLPAAFGINLNSEQPLSYFQKHGMRPRLFMGYNKDVFFASPGSFYDPSTGGTYPYKVEDRVLDFLSNFEFYWYYYYDVYWSISNAQNDTPDLRYGWKDGLDLNFYGYTGLYINSYNYKSDWSN